MITHSYWMPAAIVLTGVGLQEPGKAPRIPATCPFILSIYVRAQQVARSRHRALNFPIVSGPWPRQTGSGSPWSAHGLGVRHVSCAPGLMFATKATCRWRACCWPISSSGSREGASRPKTFGTWTSRSRRPATLSIPLPSVCTWMRKMCCAESCRYARSYLSGPAGL